MARIAVIGGGIIGSAAATWLIGDGHTITLFEPEPDGLPASSGNASLIALPEIAPLAAPGILASVPGWLLDPLGPLTVRWADMPSMLPWLLAFLGSATPGAGVRGRAALTTLMQTALADHEQLARLAGLENHLRQLGMVSVHDSKRSLEAAAAEAALVRGVLGYEFETLAPAAARRLVPQLEGEFFGALHQPVYRVATNPLAVLRHYQGFATSRGTLVPARVLGLRRSEEGIEVRTTEGAAGTFERVVVAAGIWSRDLVRGLGLKVLLETERGYNTTYTDLDWNLPMPVGFPDHGFISTPLIDGLRVGGAVEMAQPGSPPNYARAKAMRAKMRRYVPALPEGGKEWMGRRPSTPDSLPVIGNHPGDPRIVFAFGHGHLGLTLSAVTARLVAGLVAGRAGLTPFGIERFQ